MTEMRQLLLVIHFIIFFTAATLLHSQPLSYSGEPPYKEGETLTYELSYTWGGVNTDVGQGTAKMNYSDGFYNPVITGKTYKFYDIFFKVRENFQSWFLYDGLLPMRFTRDTHEGKYVSRNTYEYRRGGIAGDHIRADVYTSTSGDRYAELPLDRCTFDLPSLFFFARNIDYSRVVPDVKYPMTFAIDDDVYNVYFIMRGKEVKKIKGLGTVRTVKFSVKLLSGNVFTGEEDLSLWITDDDNRIPVLFEAPILVGVASGRLTSWSGLKHPFSSLVKK